MYGGPDSSNGNADKDEDNSGKPKPDDSNSDTDGDTNNVDLCSGGSIDDIFGTEDGNYYVFKGSKYWKLTGDSVAKGYPRRISDDWPGIPNNIDAAVTWTENSTFKYSLYLLTYTARSRLTNFCLHLVRCDEQYAEILIVNKLRIFFFLKITS